MRLLLGLVSYEQAIRFYNQEYESSPDVRKILLKCWLYDCQSSHKAGRLCHSFDVYLKRKNHFDFIKLIRGFCIDSSDLGGVEYAVDLVTDFYTHSSN